MLLHWFSSPWTAQTNFACNSDCGKAGSQKRVACLLYPRLGILGFKTDPFGCPKHPHIPLGDLPTHS